MNRTLDPTTASESELFAWLAAQPCRWCSGDKEVLYDDTEKLEPCRDCQDANGKPTGLAFGWASKRCPGEGSTWTDEDYDVDADQGYVNIGPVEVTKNEPCRGEHCPQCGGSGRILEDVGLEELFEHGGLYFINKEWDRLDSDGHVWAAHARNKGISRAGRGETRTLAALRAVAKAAVGQ